MAEANCGHDVPEAGNPNEEVPEASNPNEEVPEANSPNKGVPEANSPNEEVPEANGPNEVPEANNEVPEANGPNEVPEANSREEVPEANSPDEVPEQKPQVIYRCKKCRRIVAGQESVIFHEQGNREPNYIRRKKNAESKTSPECATIFVEPMKWMQTVEEGYVAEKLYCMGCNSRIGSFNWAGMQCTCGVWVNPAFQLHKTRIDECRS